MFVHVCLSVLFKRCLLPSSGWRSGSHSCFECRPSDVRGVSKRQNKQSWTGDGRRLGISSIEGLCHDVMRVHRLFYRITFASLSYRPCVNSFIKLFLGSPNIMTNDIPVLFLVLILLLTPTLCWYFTDQPYWPTGIDFSADC